MSRRKNDNSYSHPRITDSVGFDGDKLDPKMFYPRSRMVADDRRTRSLPTSPGPEEKQFAEHTQSGGMRLVGSYMLVDSTEVQALREEVVQLRDRMINYEQILQLILVNLELQRDLWNGGQGQDTTAAAVAGVLEQTCGTDEADTGTNYEARFKMEKEGTIYRLSCITDVPQTKEEAESEIRTFLADLGLEFFNNSGMSVMKENGELHFAQHLLRRELDNGVIPLSTLLESAAIDSTSIDLEMRGRGR